MGGYSFTEASNQAAGFSGFGGHRLTDPHAVTGDGDRVMGITGDAPIANLESLGIEDAEQLVAVAAIQQLQGELRTSLGLKAAEFRSLLDRAREMLPADRAALVSTPAPRDLGLGVLPPTPEILMRAESGPMLAELDEAEAMPVELPGAVNLIPYMSPVRNQRSRGTCVSFTLSALNEYIWRRRGRVRDLSEQHLYYEIKLIDGIPNGCGTYQVEAVKALRDRGQCRETIWPYDPNPPCNNHGTLPPAARTNGRIYRLNTIQVPARDVSAYKRHMARQRPVTLSIPVYDSWYQSAETRRSGRITMRIGNEQASGGHAVMLVGYQDSAASPGGGYFLVRNSWGTTSWGYQCPYGAGYGTIPYQYITNDAWEAYTAVVPGITGEEEGEEGEEEHEDGMPGGKSTVTIQVSPNVKITITSS
jgi:hypothetical protein